MSFITSPEIVLAYGLAGRLSFNPLTDPLVAADGKEYRLEPPPPAPELPERGFVGLGSGYEPPAEDAVACRWWWRRTASDCSSWSPSSRGMAATSSGSPCCSRASGKCTTDHISPAGPWLRFRGHLERLSDNAFLGAVNAFTGEAGKGLNQETGGRDLPFPQVARDYKARGLRWVAVGDDNYGEGSSREHAAMSPRYLGAAAIIVRGFARIHESNLKKQGLLPLTFADAADYDRVKETDRVSITGLASLAPGRELTAALHHADGATDQVTLRHTMNAEQIEWFKAGAALNILAGRVA